MNASQYYREAEVAGAGPVRLVILLYEQAIEDLRRALVAQERGDVESRTREINHAVLVIGHLEATLDKQQGGIVAVNLERFYQKLRAGLVEAQCRQSPALLNEQISHLMDVRDAWCQVEKLLLPTSPQSQPQGEPGVRSEWNA